MKLLPREEKFFVLFLNQVSIISDASRLLLQGVKGGYAGMAEVSRQIMDLEHKGDEVIHGILTRLNQTFITPLDPEDIHSLSSSLDDVLDYIEDAAFRITAYRLDPIPPAVVKLAELVDLCCQSLNKAFQALEKNQKLMEDCIEINRLENEADLLVRGLVAELFDKEKDPIALIKMKEVYEVLEATTDRCEDVADALQNVVVKNS